jgi:hypothetical protein
MGMAIMSATSVPRQSVPSPSLAAILRKPSSVPRYTGAAKAAVEVQAGPQAGAPRTGAGPCGASRKQSQAAKLHFLHHRVGQTTASCRFGKRLQACTAPGCWQERNAVLWHTYLWLLAM